MNDEDRLEALTRRLAATRPVLDDMTRARLASRIAEAIAAPPAAPSPRPRSRARIAAAVGTAAVCAAGVCAAAVYGTRGPTALRVLLDSVPPGAGVVAPTLPRRAERRVAYLVVSPELVAPPEPPAPPALAPHARAWVAPADSVTLSLGSAPAGAIVLGPGWVERTRTGLAVDASGVMVDLPAGGAPVELRFRTAKIRVTSASFGVAGAPARVAVTRGEVAVECGQVRRNVQAGQVAQCPAAPAPVAAAAPAPVAAAAPAPPAAEQALALAGQPRDAEPPVAAERPVPVDEIYARAEALMRAGKTRDATALLEEVAAAPDAALLGALALLDLARLASRAGDTHRALGYLDRLAAAPSRGVVADPAAYLRCEAELALDRASAASCLEAYLRDFRDGVRRADARARLAAWYEARGRCDDARRVAATTAALGRCAPPARSR